MHPSPANVAPPPRRSQRWLRLGLPAGLALILGLAGYQQFWLSRPMGEGPAGPAVPREPFAKTWTTRPVLLVGIGDSVTAGFGASPRHAYFELLVTNAPDETPDLRGLCLAAVLPNLQFTNLALSGSTSLYHAQSALTRLAPQPPNVLGLVVLTTGGNDLIHNYGRTPPAEGAMYGATLAQARPWIEDFSRRLEQMIQRITAAFPGGCHLFLANIYDPTDGVGDLQRAGLPAWPEGLAILDAYNRVLAESAARHPHVHAVNLHDTFLGHGIHCRQFWRTHYRAEDPHYWYFTNLEDPNDRGYDAIRRLFLIEMAKLRPEAWR
jgi:lysophospholipase L1-like esterase